MHDNLTSEIKLLTGKLNSMEEFRLQRDDLMAKFDTQEIELKEQAKKHKAILYEMERKVILDKERMRKDVENKLLELSNEFTKTSDLRVAASTQRILRENIALNNDMDRILVMQNRLQRESEEMKKKHKDIVSQYDASVAEKKRLIKTCEQQLEVIRRMTTENENSRDLNAYLLDIKRSHEVARKMTRDKSMEMTMLKEKINSLEQHIRVIDSDRHQMKCDSMYHKNEHERIADILKTVRLTVKSALKSETSEHDPAFHESRRSNLLADLLNILNNLEKRTAKPSLETIPSISNFYSQGDLGFMPKETDYDDDDDDDDETNDVSIKKFELPKIYVDSSRFKTPSFESIDVHEKVIEEDEKSELEIKLIDPMSGSLSLISEKASSAATDDDDDNCESDEPTVVAVAVAAKSIVAPADEDDFDDDKIGELIENKNLADADKTILSIDLRSSIDKHDDYYDEHKDKESILSGTEVEGEFTADDEEQ
jgi:hypothetical protein